MAVSRAQLDGRSLICLRKYRICFLLGITILCLQVYLAYTFFTMENEARKLAQSASNGEPGYNQLRLPPDKGKSGGRSANAQRNRTRAKLDLSTLNFTPGCEITNKEAVSAVTRAQSQSCKQHIVNVTCLYQQGTLYPKRLPSTCPHSMGFNTTPTNLGCFADDKTSRLLSGHYAVFKGNNSPEQCANLCLQSGFPYSGVEYSVECFCGVDEPPKIKRLADSSCNMKCPGDSKLSCGGYLTINVYWNGIQKFKALEARNSSTKTNNEKPVRVAYLLTVNGRASRQVKRLINVLYHPSHLIYIHVDARQDYMYREMLEVEKKCKRNNIKVAKGSMRHASIWGGASLLTTFITSAQQMLNHSTHWDYLVNLSESDFPVKNNTYLTEFLAWNKGLNFVKSHGREVQRFITKQGLDKTFVECEARMWRVGDRKLPYGIQIDGGSDWVALNRDFVEYVVRKNPDPLVAGLVRLFRFTLLPAESFFHTVLRNSKFCNTYVDNNLHVTNWKRKLGCKCQYKAVVDWCGCSPNDFKLQDFNRIKNTAERNLFFARKFEPVIDQRIIDKVEEWLYPERANASISAKGYDMYWQSLYHFADLSPLNDDTLVTVSDSLARLVLHQFMEDRADVKLLEATALFNQNKLYGILVKVETTLKNLEASTFQGDYLEKIEALVRLKKRFSVSESWSGSVLNFQVGTDYDQKEQVFRNLIGGVGPFSSPVLAYEFDLDQTAVQNLTLLWIDPQGNLADVNNLQLEESTMIGHVKPHLGERLLVGTWHLLLISKDLAIANLKFLVTPLAFWKNKRISAQKFKESHDTSKRSYHLPEEVIKKWSGLVESVIIKETMEGIAHGKQRFSSELNRWIDTLTSQYYRVEKRCLINRHSSNKRKLQYCQDTSWSSLSPDPKSDITNLCHQV